MCLRAFQLIIGKDRCWNTCLAAGKKRHADWKYPNIIDIRRCIYSPIFFQVSFHVVITSQYSNTDQIVLYGADTFAAMGCYRRFPFLSFTLGHLRPSSRHKAGGEMKEILLMTALSKHAFSLLFKDASAFVTTCSSVSQKFSLGYWLAKP